MKGTAMIGSRRQLVLRRLTPYFFLLPALLFVFAFVIYPMCHAFVTSLYNPSVIGQKDVKFVGFANFSRLLTERTTYTILLNNVKYSVAVTAGTVLIGLVLALLLDQEVHGWRVFRVAFYLPVVLASVLVAKLWMAFYEPHFGLFNQTLKMLGLSDWTRVWLGDDRIALTCIIVISIWQYSGYTMVFFLAALQNIPAELTEAARIDGVESIFGIARHIKIPLISPVITIVVMLQIIGTFKIYDIIWATTKGGPGTSSSVLSILLYKEAFMRNAFGYAEAVAVFMFVIIFAISIGYLAIARFGKEERA
jgi:raffinose/stachyose/melibiose transport system permease protein